MPWNVEATAARGLSKRVEGVGRKGKKARAGRFE
jgi:hypothetical protein